MDRIEDASLLSQAHRIWLLEAIKGITTTFLIRNFVYNNYGEFDDMTGRQIEDVVEYIFDTHIEK